MDVPSKVIQQGKLARLVRGFEHDRIEPERLDKSICKCRVLVSILVEQSDSLRAFSCFDDQLDGTRVEPVLPLFNPRRKRPLAEPAVVFLAKLHLHVEPAALRSGNDLTRIEIAVREPLTAFDSRDADVRA